MHRLICWALILSAFFSFFFLASFIQQIPANDRSSVKKQNYMGLDGELTNLPIWCSTCAVVGMSGHLLQHEFGSEIDETHSCIFRFGFSPIRGMERFVGSVTTARIVDSFSFFPFLKRPWKLVTGPFASKAWILFDRRPGDISWFHRPLLSHVVRKHDTKFLWMAKGSEASVYQYLKTQTKRRVFRISALWFALKVTEDAGCKSVRIYGVPDHHICKRSMNVTIPSLYWQNSSLPLCINGVDASLMTDHGTSPIATLPSVPERKILLQWHPDHLAKLQFRAPGWPP